MELIGSCQRLHRASQVTKKVLSELKLTWTCVSDCCFSINEEMTWEGVENRHDFHFNLSLSVSQEIQGERYAAEQIRGEETFPFKQECDEELPFCPAASFPFSN